MKQLWKNSIYRNSRKSSIGKKQEISSVLKRSGENSSLAKLTAIQVMEIIELYKTGNYSMRKLGVLYGVSHRQIGYIIQGKSWNSLTKINGDDNV